MQSNFRYFIPLTKLSFEYAKYAIKYNNFIFIPVLIYCKSSVAHPKSMKTKTKCDRIGCTIQLEASTQYRNNKGHSYKGMFQCFFLMIKTP
jgi:hypothetical protein